MSLWLFIYSIYIYYIFRSSIHISVYIFKKIKLDFLFNIKIIFNVIIITNADFCNVFAPYSLLRRAQNFKI